MKLEEEVEGTKNQILSISVNEQQELEDLLQEFFA